MNNKIDTTIIPMDSLNPEERAKQLPYIQRITDRSTELLLERGNEDTWTFDDCVETLHQAIREFNDAGDSPYTAEFLDCEDQDLYEDSLAALEVRLKPRVRN